MLTGSLAVALSAALSASVPPLQSPPSEPPAAQAPAGPTVEQTASPSVVGPVANELGVTPKQAEAAAGTVFGLSRAKLSASDFARVASAVPNMEGLLKAAPAPGKQSAQDAIAGQAAAASGLGAVAGVAGTLTKLGLKPEQMAKLAPTLVKVVQSRGGAEVASLLQSALK